MTLRELVRNVEAGEVERLLVSNNWNVARAAREAGYNRADFYKVMKRHGITRPQNSFDSPIFQALHGWR